MLLVSVATKLNQSLSAVTAKRHMIEEMLREASMRWYTRFPPRPMPKEALVQYLCTFPKSADLRVLCEGGPARAE